MLEQLLAALNRMADAAERSNELTEQAHRLIREGREGREGRAATTDTTPVEVEQEQTQKDLEAAVAAEKAAAAEKAKAARARKAAAKTATETNEVTTRTRAAAAEAAPTKAERSPEAVEVEASYYDEVLRPAVARLASIDRKAALDCLKAEGVTKATELDPSRWQHLVAALNKAYAEVAPVEDDNVDDFA